MRCPPPRLADWPARLGSLCARRLAMPFAWGRNDCASWGADVAFALHGQDTLAELRGRRSGWRQAREQLREGGGIPAALARAGLREVAPVLAQRGDLVMLRQGRRRVLAVCLGDVAAAPGSTGLAHMAMAAAVAAWRL